MRTRPQAGAKRLVKVSKGHIGDGEVWSVWGLDPTSLRSISVEGGVCYNQSVLEIMKRLI